MKLDDLGVPLFPETSIDMPSWVFDGRNLRISSLRMVAITGSWGAESSGWMGDDMENMVNVDKIYFEKLG